MAVTKQFQNLDFQYNQAIRLTLERSSSLPATAGIHAGYVIYSTARTAPLYLHRTVENGGAPAGTPSWQWMFAFAHSNITNLASIAANEDKLLIYDASAGSYHFVTADQLQATNNDVMVKAWGASNQSGYLNQVLVPETNGGVVFTQTNSTWDYLAVRMSVGDLLTKTDNFLSSHFLAIAEADNNTASKKATIANINTVLEFIKLYDVDETSYTGKNGFNLYVNGNTVKFREVTPIANGGTNNSATALNGQLVYYNGTGPKYDYLSNGTLGYVLVSGGANQAPTWTAAWTNKSYVAEFENADWTLDGVTLDYTYTILAATHELGTGAEFGILVYEEDSGTYYNVSLETSIVSSTGAITLVSSAAFTGYAMIIKHI